MSVAASIDHTSSVWADYVWLARGERSRLYPVVRDFLDAIEAAAAYVTADLLNEFRRRRRFGLLKYRLEYLFHAASGHRQKRERYRNRITDERRAIRNAGITLGASRLERGPLSAIMDRWGSDKASGGHNYTLFYDRLFHDGRSRYARVFELGIGSNHPDTPTNMGSAGVPGASLRGWREYFTTADIFGGDIDRRVLFEEERIKTGFVDQTKPDLIENLLGSIGGRFDLVIGDGLHQLEANRTFFDGAFKRLKEGGIYIIEDVASYQRGSYAAFLSPYDTAILDIPHLSNRHDNCLAVVVKEGEGPI